VRCGVLFFPSVLIQLIGFERGSAHQFARQGIVEIGLDLLTQFAETFAIKVEFAREPGGTFAFGNPAQQQNDCRGRLAGFDKHGTGQNGVRALAASAAVRRKERMFSEQPAVGAAATRADQTSRMEILLKPRNTGRIIEQFDNWKVYHATEYTMHTQAP
jgi:hypothetical protein